jgi:class 3 adenylate cyclase/tetratricopeptide (TPR) repeat protein
MTRCPRCSEDNPPRARFCLACGLPLDAQPVEQAEERRLVTAVFVDLVGSTAKGDRVDPEDVRARLVPFHDGVRTGLERFGGTVEKFIGDAVVALFGAPIANEDDPERALRAAFAVREAVAALTTADAWLALDVRIGVATGEAIVRVDARAAEGEALAMGDVMNTAARIQSAATPGGILVDRATRRATAHAVDYRELDPVDAKGKRDPVDVWEALDLRAAPRRRRSDTPFVGRELELAVLRGQWRRVQADGAPATALVVAEAGTGKTRLLAACTDALGVAAHWGRCLPYGEGGAYAAVAEILTAAGVEQAIAEAPLDDDVRRTVEASVDAILGSVGEITKGELHWGIRRALELAATGPTVLVFDDLHWADPSLLELIGALEGAAAPFLILGSSRPGLDQAFAQPADRRLVIELPPLTAAESEALASELLGDAPGSELLAPVVAAAHGNPLYLEETMHMLADEGLLAGGAAPERLPTPPSLASMIAARLDRLPGQERHLALRAAVLGASFWPGAVAILDGDRDVERGLEGLVAFDVAEERPTSTVAGEREFAFRHDLIRDVAYGRLPKGLRVELHVRSADWFAARQQHDEYAEVGAHHLEQACRLALEIERSPLAPPFEAAAEALRVAAEKAERREGLHEADAFYSRALELVGDEEAPVAAAELRLGRARILSALGRLHEACDRFRTVAADAGALGREDLRGVALVGLGNVLQKQGRGEEARFHVVDARKVAEATGDTRLEVQALFELSELDRDFAGDVDTAVVELERALELATRLDDRRLLAEGELRRGFVLSSAGRLAEAEQALARSAEIGARLGSRRDESRATFFRAYVTYHRGRPAEAERLALEAQEWFERTGDSYFRVQGLRSLASYARARGDLGAAEQRLRAALLLAEPSGGWLVSELQADLARLYVGLGRLDEARAAATAAAATAPEDDPAVQAAVCVAVARLAAAEGDRETTRHQAREAIESYGDFDNALQLAPARIDVARALAAVGDGEEALEQLRLAVEECSRIGAVMLLSEAESALTELAPA